MKSQEVEGISSSQNAVSIFFQPCPQLKVIEKIESIVFKILNQKDVLINFSGQLLKCSAKAKPFHLNKSEKIIDKIIYVRLQPRYHPIWHVKKQEAIY